MERRKFLAGIGVGMGMISGCTTLTSMSPMHSKDHEPSLQEVKILNKSDKVVQWELEIYKNGSSEFIGNDTIAAHNSLDISGDTPTGNGSYVAILSNLDNGSTKSMGVGPSHLLDEFSFIFTITESGKVIGDVK